MISAIKKLLSSLKPKTYREIGFLIRFIAGLIVMGCAVLTSNQIFSSQYTSQLVFKHQNAIRWILNGALVWFPAELLLLWLHLSWMLRSKRLFGQEPQEIRKQFAWLTRHSPAAFPHKSHEWLQHCNPDAQIPQWLTTHAEDMFTHPQMSPRMFARYFYIAFDESLSYTAYHARKINLLHSCGSGFGVLGTLLFMAIALKKMTAGVSNKIWLGAVAVAIMTTAFGLITTLLADTISAYTGNRLQQLEEELHELIVTLDPEALGELGYGLQPHESNKGPTQ